MSTRSGKPLHAAGERWLAPLHEVPNLEIREISLSRPNSVFRALFERNQIPAIVARERFDLLCSIADTTSLAAPCPKLIWIRNYLIHTPRDVGWPLSGMPRIWLLRYLSRKSMRGADRIIFVSQASRDEIGRLNRLPESQADVIYHGISEAFLTAPQLPDTQR